MNEAKNKKIPALLRDRGFLRLGLAVLVFNAGYSIYLFLFNFYLASQGQHEARMGGLAGAMVLGGVLGALPAARAANRWGSARTMAAFLLLCGLLLGLRLLPGPLGLEWFLALLSGVFLSGWTVLIFPLIAAVTAEEQRASAFQILYGLATGAGCVGAVVGGNFPALCARLAPGLSVADTQRMGLLLGAGLVCLSTLWLPRTSLTARVETVARMRMSKRLLILLGVSALWALLLGAMNPFSGIFFQSQFRMELPDIGGFFFVVQAVVAVGLMLTGASGMARLPAWVLLVGAQLVVATSFVGMATRTLLLAEAAYLTFMLAQQLSQPALQSLLLGQASATERNQIAGWNAMLAAVAQALAAQGFGLLWGRWGYTAVLPFLAAGACAAAVVSAVVLRASENGTPTA
jgi:predicted MFS family arabinose efflux permease